MPHVPSSFLVYAEMYKIKRNAVFYVAFSNHARSNAEMSMLCSAATGTHVSRRRRNKRRAESLPKMRKGIQHVEMERR